MQTQLTEIKSNGGSPVVTGFHLDTSVVEKSIGELVDLEIKRKLAADDLSICIKDVAKQAGISKSTLSKYVKARAGDKFEEQKRGVEQLAMLFEEV